METELETSVETNHKVIRSIRSYKHKWQIYDLMRLMKFMIYIGAAERTNYMLNEVKLLRIEKL